MVIFIAKKLYLSLWMKPRKYGCVVFSSSDSSMPQNGDQHAISGDTRVKKSTSLGFVLPWCSQGRTLHPVATHKSGGGVCRSADIVVSSITVTSNSLIFSVLVLKKLILGVKDFNFRFLFKILS